MKKLLIILGLIVVILIAGLVFASLINPSENIKLANQNQAVNQDNTLKPFTITVGIYDPAKEPNELTKLLESRLKEIGFQAVIINELVDPLAADSEKTTLLYRTSTEPALKVFTREVIQANLYRQGKNEAINQDIIISAWNLEDIKWGDFSELAEKYLNPEAGNVSVLVLNAGAKSGQAAKLADLLKEAGYRQAQAENSETIASQPALIYYQRNFKNPAKAVQKILQANNYPDATYRVRLNQPANLVIELGQNTATSTAEN